MTAWYHHQTIQELTLNAASRHHHEKQKMTDTGCKVKFESKSHTCGLFWTPTLKEERLSIQYLNQGRTGSSIMKNGTSPILIYRHKENHIVVILSLSFKRSPLQRSFYWTHNYNLIQNFSHIISETDNITLAFQRYL